MRQGYFVTGTDTGVGKTLISAALIHFLINEGLRVSGMKPVASGCYESDGRFRNDDADSLIEAANVSAEYDCICPYRFLPPVAPHIAAEMEDIEISLDHLYACFQQLQMKSDVVVVEGAGGWQVPLNPQYRLSDLAIKLQLPVIIVVGARLGCINHALLTAESIEASGLQVAGWVLNRIDPDVLAISEVKKSLQSRMPGSMIADIPWQKKPDPAVIAYGFKMTSSV